MMNLSSTGIIILQRTPTTSLILMNKTQVVKVSSLSMLVLLISAGSFFMRSHTAEAKPSNLTAEAGSQAIRDDLARIDTTELNSKKDLIDAYCKTVALHADGFIDQAYNLAYSPQQSMFVTVLCTSLGNKPLFLHEKILRTTERAGIAPFLPVECRPENLEYCNIAELSSSLFNAIMNDHSTL
jgi:hypothetical protein